METRTHTSFQELLDDMGEFSRDYAGSSFVLMDDPIRRMLGFYEVIGSVLWQISFVDFKRTADQTWVERMKNREGRGSQ